MHQYVSDRNISSNGDMEVVNVWNMTYATNGSLQFIPLEHMYEDAGHGGFFDTYFSMPRFVTESTLATASVLSNALALVALVHVYGRQTVYHRLFVNLAVANILASILAWISNNMFYIFGEHIEVLLVSGTSLCQIIAFLLAAVFVSSSFGIVSTLTMLGFTTVQYFAICRPLHHLSIVRKRKICIFLTWTWIVSLAFACVPCIVVWYRAKHGECDADMLDKILQVIVFGANCSTGVVGIVYILIVLMCIRIYTEIRNLQIRLNQFRFKQEVSSERKAFVTIVILLTTLSLFFIPYACLYVITLNATTDVDIQNNVLIYYMVLLPYLKFLTDPLIYGMRMKEVKDAWLRIFIKCGITVCRGNIPDIMVLPPSTASINMPAVTAV